MSFTVLKKDSKTNARLGIFKTSHGVVQTPSYVIVATHAQVKCLQPADLKKTKTQIVIANTYHLRNAAEKTGKKKDFIAKTLGVALPTMTDSGGFQVFSLGAAKEHRVGKVLKRFVHSGPRAKNLTRISEKGVAFTIDGKREFLSPESSIAVQEKLGADVIFAFDECTSPLHSFAYTKEAMERTHRWAVRCLAAHHRSDQALFGIVQGGRYTTLRRKSAKYIGSLPFDGFGIGGSFGEDTMAQTLKTVVPHLPDEKPRHLLGIGKIRDIFTAIENGVDLFDCVIPTREARHGRIWTRTGPYDIRKSAYAKSGKRLAPRCYCPTCASGMTQKKLNRLFKAKHPDSGRYATMHNIWFFNTLLERVRASIQNGTFSRLKKKYTS